jgi:hypothetical protein
MRVYFPPTKRQVTLDTNANGAISGNLPPEKIEEIIRAFDLDLPTKTTNVTTTKTTLFKRQLPKE